jgi:hypothetical protein
LARQSQTQQKLSAFSRQKMAIPLLILVYFLWNVFSAWEKCMDEMRDPALAVLLDESAKLCARRQALCKERQQLLRSRQDLIEQQQAILKQAWTIIEVARPYMYCSLPPDRYPLPVFLMGLWDQEEQLLIQFGMRIPRPLYELLGFDLLD